MCGKPNDSIARRDVLRKSALIGSASVVGIGVAVNTTEAQSESDEVSPDAYPVPCSSCRVKTGTYMRHPAYNNCFLENDKLIPMGMGGCAHAECEHNNFGKFVAVDWDDNRFDDYPWIYAKHIMCE